MTDEYTTPAGGRLKLKGNNKVTDGRIDKKKKKSKSKTKTEGQGQGREIEPQPVGDNDTTTTATTTANEPQTQPASSSSDVILKEKGEEEGRPQGQGQSQGQGNNNNNTNNNNNNKEGEGEGQGQGQGEEAVIVESGREVGTTALATGAGKTEAERKYDEAKRKRLQERLRREGVKTHKERVEELNKYLSRLTEHHDMPKIGPG